MQSSPRRTNTFLHPASGLLILGLDWLFFSGTALSLGLTTPALALLGFGIGALGTGMLQRIYGGEGRLKSVLKGLLGGLVVGIPLPIAGTAVGGFILALSGLNRLRGNTTDSTSSPPPSLQDDNE